MNTSNDDIQNATASLNDKITDESSVVRSIQSDENQLRTLVVVLSLAGGLVLALTLGFGIYLYWHCCSSRRQQKKKLSHEQNGYFSDDDDIDSFASNDKPRDKHASHRPAQSAPLEQNFSVIAPMPQPPSIPPTNIHYNGNHSGANSIDNSCESMPASPTPVVVNHGPAPSAPSAKELDRAGHQHICHHNDIEASNSNSDSIDYMLIYGTAGQQQQQHNHHHIHHFHSHAVGLPEQPPPAYTSLTP
ncbi:hypothetical protein BDB00DRAFT_496933 [Zychaea mexicana]|uniref:uncharacterized protein n=1 Tax=Zychaea mexicana TaxID=64656 RepID=UPI0022FF2362|nr:uncharacterized protein BDB00DRAFT_496933 [Zychaea mexicana]KAI9498063.1 hypothetical protein BDB00DRAFT_496933 [Zychaea mexicana]